MATIASLIHRMLVGREDDGGAGGREGRGAASAPSSRRTRAAPDRPGAELPRGVHPRHPSAAALVTLLTTPLFRRLSFALGAVVSAPTTGACTREPPRARSAGAAILLGFLVGMARGVRRSRSFEEVFDGEHRAARRRARARCVIFAVGQVDDLREVSPPAKIAGTVLAGSVLSIAGVSILFFRIPFVGLLSLSPDLSPLLTVLWVIGMANAINFIDGLDGLAAGIVAIAAGAFLLYCDRLDEAAAIGPATSARSSRRSSLGDLPRVPPAQLPPARRSSWATPARCCSACSWRRRRSPSAATPTTPFSGQTFFFFAPLFIPLVILGVPIIDTAFSIVRRARRAAVTVADKDHLHHRLMRLGHGQRRSVLILWTWTALLSAIVLYPTYTSGRGDLYVPMRHRGGGAGALHDVRARGPLPPRCGTLSPRVG